MGQCRSRCSAYAPAAGERNTWAGEERPRVERGSPTRPLSTEASSVFAEKVRVGGAVQALRCVRRLSRRPRSAEKVLRRSRDTLVTQRLAPRRSAQQLLYFPIQAPLTRSGRDCWRVAHKDCQRVISGDAAPCEQLRSGCAAVSVEGMLVHLLPRRRSRVNRASHDRTGC